MLRNLCIYVKSRQNQTGRGTRKLSHIPAVTSLFNYFLIKFAYFYNTYYYKQMLQMEINDNSPLQTNPNHVDVNRLVKFISSCLQKILIYCTQSSIYKSLCQGCINLQSPINSLLFLRAKKCVSCRNKSRMSALNSKCSLQRYAD